MLVDWYRTQALATEYSLIQDTTISECQQQASTIKYSTRASASANYRVQYTTISERQLSGTVRECQRAPVFSSQLIPPGNKSALRLRPSFLFPLTIAELLNQQKQRCQ